MERRRVRALSARTEFIDGFGMISFDPDSGREELNFPLVPVDAIDSLVAKGWVADDVEEAEAAPAAASKPRGKTKAAAPAAASEEAPAS